MEDAEAVRRAAEESEHPNRRQAHRRLDSPSFRGARRAAFDGPVFVHDYPAALCPLTKRKRDNPAIAERFELYVQGMELANAYTELNDPDTQEATFRQQVAGLPEEESMARMDEDFVRALRHGMPPAGGSGHRHRPPRHAADQRQKHPRRYLVSVTSRPGTRGRGFLTS